MTVDRLNDMEVKIRQLELRLKFLEGMPGIKEHVDHFAAASAEEHAAGLKRNEEETFAEERRMRARGRGPQVRLPEDPDPNANGNGQQLVQDVTQSGTQQSPGRTTSNPVPERGPLGGERPSGAISGGGAGISSGALRRPPPQSYLDDEMKGR